MVCEASLLEARVHPCRFTAEVPRLWISTHSPSVSATEFGSTITSLLTIWPEYPEVTKAGAPGVTGTGAVARSLQAPTTNAASGTAAWRRRRRTMRGSLGVGIRTRHRWCESAGGCRAMWVGYSEDIHT